MKRPWSASSSGLTTAESGQGACAPEEGHAGLLARYAALETLYRAVFDHAAEPMYLIDGDGCVADVNSVALRRMGYQREALLGQPFALLLDSSVYPLVGQRLRAVRARGRMVFESCHITRTGERVYVEVTDTLLKLGNEEYLLCVARDISERRIADEAMSHRLRLERLVSEMTTLHANVAPQNVDAVIDDTLQAIGGFLDVDRSYLFQLRENGLMDNTHEWCADGIQCYRSELQGIEKATIPWWMEQIERSESVIINDVDELPLEAAFEQAILREQGIVAVVGVPLLYGKQVRGFLGLDLCRPGRLWSDEDLTLLETLVNSIGHMLEGVASLRKLQSEQQRMVDIINALNIHIAVVDGEGCITHVNDAWRETLHEAHCVSGCVGGMAAEGAECALHDLSDEASKGIALVLGGATGYFQMEYRITGSERSFLLQVTPLGSDIQGAVIARTEITRLRQAERNLAQSEGLYRSLLQNMQEGLVLLDGGGVIRHVNQRFAHMLGYAVGELQGRAAVELAASGNGPVLESLLHAQGAEGRKAEEVMWHHREGHRVYSLCSPAPMRDAQGGVEGMFMVVTDITERRILQGQLLQAQKLESIGQLAAGIAHEINTPAQYVSNNVAFLRQAVEDVAGVVRQGLEVLRSAGAGQEVALQAREVVESAESVDVEYLLEEMPRALAESEDGIGRISTIVRSVKQFAHPGSEAIALTDINAAIQSTVNVSRNEWKYVAELVTELDPALPPVPCVAGEFNQVVLNLVVNAAHAIEERLGKGGGEKGCITVSTAVKGACAEVRVADTGTGIPEAIQHKIFTPFFTTKEVGRGTGQGLSIARTAVVEKLGGTLTFETSMGVGTTFIITLPLDNGRGA